MKLCFLLRMLQALIRRSNLPVHLLAGHGTNRLGSGSNSKEHVDLALLDGTASHLSWDSF